MKIGIDGRSLQSGQGGVFVYTKNILRSMARLGSGHEFKLFLNRYKNSKSKTIEEILSFDNVKKYEYRFPNKVLNSSFKFFKWPKIDKLLGGCDVLFFPTIMYGAFGRDTKSVLTMHDLSFEIFPEFFTARQKIWHKMMNPKAMCERSSKIICVSESTRQDIISIYGIDQEKIKTIHSGVNQSFSPALSETFLSYVKSKYHIPEGEMITQICTLEPRKNHIATVDAFAKWVLEFPTESKGYRLLFVGHKGWKSGELMRAIRSSLVGDRIHIVSDVLESDMPAFYSLSKIFIYPSFYEGFGFPILEAFASGVPVIASANSSMTEIAQDAALLINPYKINEIVFAIRSLANDSRLAEILKIKGYERVREFSWEKTAKETLKVIESV